MTYLGEHYAAHMTYGDIILRVSFEYLERKTLLTSAAVNNQIGFL